MAPFYEQGRLALTTGDRLALDRLDWDAATKQRKFYELMLQV